MIKHEDKIDEIVKSIKKSGLSPSSIPQMVDWYQYAFVEDMVRTIRGEDGSFGFIDWVRIKGIPDSVAEAREMFNEHQGGPVMMVLTCFSEALGLMWPLRRKAMTANADCEYFVWHNRKHDRMVVFDNRRAI